MSDYNFDVDVLLNDRHVSLFPNNFNEAHKGNKQAHDNIRKRLISIFGTKSDLIIENKQQQYTVKLILPYRRYENINS